MKIIIDPFHLHHPPPGTMLVTDEKSYIDARNRILNNRLRGKMEDSNIHVFTLPFISWFSDIPEMIMRVSPLSILESKNPHIALPIGLEDEDIMSLGLLDSSVLPTESKIFHHFLCIHQPVGPAGLDGVYQLAKVVTQKKAILSHPYLTKLWEATINKLLQQCSSIIQKLLEPIMAKETTFSLIIAEGVYCCKNAMFFEHWLHENSRQFMEMGISRNTLESLFQDKFLVLEVDDKFERTLTNFVKAHLANGLMKYSDLSGCYVGEMDALLFLEPQLELAQYGMLIEKFTAKIDGAQKQKLLQLCVPEYATPPVIEGNLPEQAELWKKWAVENFIPYKFYFDEISERSESVLLNIETGSLAFSDWFYSNYKSIIADTNIFTNLAVVDHVRSLLEESNCKVIWLIIDGFPAQYTQILNAVLKAHGINKIDLNWSMATLPTITELGVPLMLSGRYQASIDISTINKRQELLSKGFEDKKCCYTNKLADFRKSLEVEFDLCCLHTHEIDKTLHKVDGEFDQSRVSEVERILNNRVKMISEVIKSNADTRFKLVISTDHGATKCLKNGQNIRNVKLDAAVKNNPRERCVELTGSLENEVVDPNEMYVLKKEMSKNCNDWAIARGYRYFGNNDAGYRHGGLTPEEVVVPVLFCEIASVTEASIHLRYIGTKDLRFGKTEREFRVKVRNTGLTAIEIVKAEVVEDRNCVFDLPIKIDPESEGNLQGAIKISQKFQSQAKGGRLPLNFILTCLVMGKEVTQQAQCVVITEKDEFEDDFDF